MSHRLTLPVLMFAWLLCSVAHAADAPAPVALGDGAVHFTPPSAESWEPSKHATARILAYTTKKHDAIVAIELLPDDMVVDKETTGAIVKQLRGAHGQAKVVLQPTVESDERFALKIHERYEVGKGANIKVADVLHLYRYVGKRLVMATVNSVSDDPEAVKAAHADAQECLVSATGPVKGR